MPIHVAPTLELRGMYAVRAGNFKGKSCVVYGGIHGTILLK